MLSGPYDDVLRTVAVYLLDVPVLIGLYLSGDYSVKLIWVRIH
jgi:hypothetical protein